MGLGGQRNDVFRLNDVLQVLQCIKRATFFGRTRFYKGNWCTKEFYGKSANQR